MIVWRTFRISGIRCRVRLRGLGCPPRALNSPDVKPVEETARISAGPICHCGFSTRFLSFFEPPHAKATAQHNRATLHDTLFVEHCTKISQFCVQFREFAFFPDFAPSSVERADLSSTPYCHRAAKSHTRLWLYVLNFKCPAAHVTGDVDCRRKRRAFLGGERREHGDCAVGRAAAREREWSRFAEFGVL